MPALAATDQFRLHLDRPAVVPAGKALIAGMAGALAAEARPGADGARRSVGGLVGRGRVVGAQRCRAGRRPVPARTMPDDGWPWPPGSRRNCAPGQFRPAWFAC